MRGIKVKESRKQRNISRLCGNIRISRACEPHSTRDLLKPSTSSTWKHCWTGPVQWSARCSQNRSIQNTPFPASTTTKTFTSIISRRASFGLHSSAPPGSSSCSMSCITILRYSITRSSYPKQGSLRASILAWSFSEPWEHWPSCRYGSCVAWLSVVSSNQRTSIACQCFQVLDRPKSVIWKTIH